MINFGWQIMHKPLVKWKENVVMSEIQPFPFDQYLAVK